MSASYFSAGLPSAPGPAIDPETEEYWTAARRGELVLPYCEQCQDYFWYPRGFCPRCMSANVGWRPSTGAGEIYAYSIVHRAFGAWVDHTPFVIAYVTLAEGITLSTNVVEVDADELRVGLPVIAFFEHNDGDEPVLRFQPKPVTE